MSCGPRMLEFTQWSRAGGRVRWGRSGQSLLMSMTSASASASRAASVSASAVVA